MQMEARKLISLLTAAFLLFDQVGTAAISVPKIPTEAQTSSAFQFTLPSDLGTVQNLISGSGPTLIHIQNAHGNYEAQKKIKAILHYLKDTYGIKTLFLEGSASKLDPGLLQFVPGDRQLNSEIAEDLTKKALVKGSELFLLEEPTAQVYGIENLKDYVANGKAFEEVLTQQDKTKAFLSDLNLQIERLSAAYLNKNLRNFLKRQSDFETKKTVPLLDWIGYLKSQAKEILDVDLTNPRNQIEWPMLLRIFKLKEFETRIEMSSYQKEKESFLKAIQHIPQETYREIEKALSLPLSQNQLPDPETGLLFEKMVSSLPTAFNFDLYPNVKIFIGHLILQSELNSERLIGEMDSLTERISQELAKTDDEKKLLILLKDYRLLQRLSVLELTPNDYEALLKRGEEISPKKLIPRFLEINRTKLVKNIGFSHIKETDALFEKAKEFYQWAKKRDSSMIEKLETRLKESDQTKAVVITGGFHSEPFEKYFQNKGYSYALISPKISNLDGRTAYIQSALKKGFSFLDTSTLEDAFLSDPLLIKNSNLINLIKTEIESHRSLKFSPRSEVRSVNVIESVFDLKGRFWATAIEGEGERILIRMNETTWLHGGSFHEGRIDEKYPMYDFFLNKDPEGYLGYLTLELDDQGAVIGHDIWVGHARRRDPENKRRLLLESWTEDLKGHQLNRQHPFLQQFPILTRPGEDEPPSSGTFPIYQPYRSEVRTDEDREFYRALLWQVERKNNYGRNNYGLLEPLIEKAIELKNPGIIPLLINFLGTDRTDDQNKTKIASRMLIDFGSLAVPELLKVLDWKPNHNHEPADYGRKSDVIKISGQINDPVLIEKLVELLNSQSSYDWKNAAKALLDQWGNNPKAVASAMKQKLLIHELLPPSEEDYDKVLKAYAEPLEMMKYKEYALPVALTTFQHEKQWQFNGAASELLRKIVDPRSVPYLIEYYNSEMSAYFRGEAFSLILDIPSAITIDFAESHLKYYKKELERIEDLTKKIGFVETALKKLQKALKDGKILPLTEQESISLLERLDFRSLFAFYERYEDLFNASTPSVTQVRGLMQQIKREVLHYPESDRAKFQERIIEEIRKYLEKFIGKKDAKNSTEEYAILESYFKIVHDNLPLILIAFQAIGKPASDFEKLRKSLPLNNPLTRIIRMLGEKPEIVGGYLDVTQRIVKSGQWEQLKNLVEELAKNYQRGSPEQVAGVLEVLRNEKNLEKWNDSDWKTFRKNVKDYYKNVFEVLNPMLYRVYSEIANDRNKILELKQDLNRELAGLYSGSFWGFSDTFMKKYRLNVVDELALMGRVMTIQNQSTRDFAGEAVTVKGALEKRGVTTWQGEVDPALRQRYALEGTTIQVVYQGSLDENDRQQFHQSLTDYAGTAAASDFTTALRTQLQKPNDVNRERLKHTAAKFIFSEQKIDSKNYAKTPASAEEEAQKWLTGWQSFFMDAFKQDGYGKLVKLVEEALAGLDEKSFATWLRTAHLQLLSINNLQMKADNEVANLLTRTDLSSNAKAQKLAEILAGWFSRVQGSDIHDEKKFEKWVLDIAPGFVQSLQAKLTRESKAVPIDLESIVRGGLALSRDKFLEVNGTKTDQARLAVIGARKETAEIWRMFAEERDFIEKELAEFKEEERVGGEQFEVGFYDDFLHLMGFMMSGVCTWQQRDLQVANASYHFGKLVLKNAAERFAALSQVQILRAGISGMKQKKSAQGWQVFALPGLNMDTGNAGVNRERGLQVLLEAAQRLAEAAGMQGAVVPLSAVIHAQTEPDQKVIAGFVHKGWLKKVSLTENVVLSTKDANQPGYSYTEVHLAQIPKDQWILKEASQQRKERKSKSVHENLTIEFADGLGEITLPAGVTAARSLQIQRTIDEIISEMPDAVLSTIRTDTQANGIKLKIVIAAEADESIVHKTDKEITLTIGEDILYVKDKIEDVKLAEMLAELLTAFILNDYAELKANSVTNENAYFKLAVVKGLLNHSRYLTLYHKVLNKFNWDASQFLSEKSERERKALFSKYETDLNKFNRGVDRINQWNLYLNVMDDADPDFMVMNYLHLVAKAQKKNVESLISAIVNMDVSRKPSLAVLRNIFKDFILKEKARIKIGNDLVDKETFGHFDSTQKLEEWKQTLLTTRSQNSFYSALKGLLKDMLPLSEEELNREISRLIDSDLFSTSPSERAKAIRKTLKEILIRRIGGSAFEGFKEHLTAERGFKNIPYLTMSAQDLEEGSDADSYGSLEYSTKDKVDYELVFKSGKDTEESVEDAVDLNDWAHELFPLPEQRSEVRVSKDAIDQFFSKLHEVLGILPQDLGTYHLDYEFKTFSQVEEELKPLEYGIKQMVLQTYRGRGFMVGPEMGTTATYWIDPNSATFRFSNLLDLIRRKILVHSQIAEEQDMEAARQLLEEKIAGRKSTRIKESQILGLDSLQVWSDFVAAAKTMDQAPGRSELRYLLTPEVKTVAEKTTDKLLRERFRLQYGQEIFEVMVKQLLGFEAIAEEREIKAVLSNEEMNSVPTLANLLTTPTQTKRQLIDYREQVPQNPSELDALILYTAYHPDVAYNLFLVGSPTQITTFRSELRHYVQMHHGIVIPSNFNVESVETVTALTPRLNQLFDRASKSQIRAAFITENPALTEIGYRPNLLRAIGSRDSVLQNATALLAGERLLEELPIEVLIRVHRGEDLDRNHIWNTLIADLRNITLVSTAA